jgi:hypothetical protein
VCGIQSALCQEVLWLKEWGGFAMVAGGAAAALLGLLFVAVSIRVNVIAGSAELRNRAAQTGALFLTVVLATLLLDVPQQERALGVEFLVLTAVTGGTLHLLDRHAVVVSASARIGRVIDAVNPNTLTCVLLAASGLTLLLGGAWGLYVFAAAVIVVLVGGVTNAWL